MVLPECSQIHLSYRHAQQIVDVLISEKVDESSIYKYMLVDRNEPQEEDVETGQLPAPEQMFLTEEEGLDWAKASFCVCRTSRDSGVGAHGSGWEAKVGKDHSQPSVFLSKWLGAASLGQDSRINDRGLKEGYMLRLSVMFNSLGPHGLHPTRLFCLWNFPSKNTGVGCHFLLQGIFLTQGSNPCLLCLPHRPAGSLPPCACSFASVMSDSLQPHGLQPTRLLCPWDSPGKNTGVGCHALLQGIFLIQGPSACLLCLLNHRQILYC